MSEALAAIIGGVLAIAGASSSVLLSGRREQRRWRDETHIAVTTEALASLQVLARHLMELSTSTSPTTTGGPAAQLDHPISAAWNAWNQAAFGVLLVSPAAVGQRLLAVDHELDRLVDVATSRQLSFTEFRHERSQLGVLAAEYLLAARSTIGGSPLQLASLWPAES